jgi:hypothetical protein
MPPRPAHTNPSPPPWGELAWNNEEGKPLVSKWERRFYIFWAVGTAITLAAAALTDEPEWEFEDQ